MVQQTSSLQAPVSQPRSRKVEYALFSEALQRIQQLEAKVAALVGLLDLARISPSHDPLATRPAKPAQLADAATEVAPGQGLRGALARGEAAKVAWTQDGTLVEALQLADAWGITPQALGKSARRGLVFAIKVRNKLFYPGVFLSLDRAPVGRVCQALGPLTPAEKLIFWLRPHGGLAGKTVAQALEAQVSLDRIDEIAGAWARERGASSADQEADHTFDAIAG